jgi:NAD(P)-dependent dehydrogenase (short-subunit alcohol dehydrogenase family)
MRLKEKVCVITGGANGIGRCLVEKFAKDGAKVAFIDRDEENGLKLRKKLHGEGCEVLFFHGDLAKEDDLTGFTDEVVMTYGHVDCLINNACFSNKGILSGCSYEDFNEVLRTGVTAPYMLSKLFMPHFTKVGSIVNISSTREHMSQKDTESYSAAKGGIGALTHALAMSLAGIARVNAVNPGWIDTGFCQGEAYEPQYSEADLSQHPSGRVGAPMDIVRVVMFLCDVENSFINGTEITVDGGMSRRMVYHGDEGWSLKGDAEGAGEEGMEKDGSEPMPGIH